MASPPPAPLTPKQCRKLIGEALVILEQRLKELNGLRPIKPKLVIDKQNTTEFAVNSYVDPKHVPEQYFENPNYSGECVVESTVPEQLALPDADDAVVPMQEESAPTAVQTCAAPVFLRDAYKVTRKILESPLFNIPPQDIVNEHVPSALAEDTMPPKHPEEEYLLLPPEAMHLARSESFSAQAVRNNAATEPLEIRHKPPDMDPMEEMLHENLRPQPKCKNTEFVYERLNDEQGAVIDYIRVNPFKIILIQAGPGVGKTFTIKTLANESNDSIVIIIYKHDLLSHFKGLATNLFTNTRFYMSVYRCLYTKANGMLMHLNRSNISNFEYFMMFISFMRWMSSVDNRYLYVFDEYTQIPKSVLLMLLMMSKIYNIGMVFCGDCNQLQAIQSTSKFKTHSAYQIVQMFADKTFELHTVNRCKDARYNDIIKFVSNLVSEDKIDTVGHAMLSAVFPRGLIVQPSTSDIFIGSEHHLISSLFHHAYSTIAKMELNLPPEQKTHFCEVYVIDGHKAKNKENIIGRLTDNHIYMPTGYDEYMEKGGVITKFLPYLPIIVGNEYYVRKRVTTQIETVVGYDPVNAHLTMRDQNGVDYILLPEDCSKVLLDAFREWLLGRRPGQPRLSAGKLFNFPIYPTFLMSAHMAQGNTISREKKLAIIAPRLTYHGLYVVMSRVQEPQQIKHVTVPNQMNMLISTAYNFPQLFLESPNAITADDLKETFRKGYVCVHVDKDANKTCLLRTKQPFNYTFVLDLVMLLYYNEELSARQKKVFFGRFKSYVEVYRQIGVIKFSTSTLNSDRNDSIRQINENAYAYAPNRLLTNVELVRKYHMVFYAMNALEPFEVEIWYKFFDEFIKEYPDTTPEKQYSTDDEITDVEARKKYIADFCVSNKSLMKQSSQKIRMRLSKVQDNIDEWLTYHGMYPQDVKMFTDFDNDPNNDDNYVYFGSTLLKNMFVACAPFNVHNLLRLLIHRIESGIRSARAKELAEERSKARIAEELKRQQEQQDNQIYENVLSAMLPEQPGPSKRRKTESYCDKALASVSDTRERNKMKTTMKVIAENLKILSKK